MRTGRRLFVIRTYEAWRSGSQCAPRALERWKTSGDRCSQTVAGLTARKAGQMTLSEEWDSRGVQGPAQVQPASMPMPHSQPVPMARPVDRPTGTGTIILGSVALALCVLMGLFGFISILLLVLLLVLIGAVVSARHNRMRVGIWSLVVVGGVAPTIAAYALFGIPEVLWAIMLWLGRILSVAGSIGVIVEGARARKATSAAGAPPAFPVPAGYTTDGQPFYPVVGYTADGQAITADRAVGMRPVVGGTNPMAVVALIGGLVLAPVGIICGHVALSQIARTGQEGKGMAIAGLVVGYAWIALVIVTLVVVAALGQW